VGDQFGKSNSKLLEKVFSWFYLSINLGAFISTLLTPIMLDKYGPSIAFGIPGLLMIMATYVFYMGRNVFIHIPPTSSTKNLATSLKRFIKLDLFKNLTLNISQTIVFFIICLFFRFFVSNYFTDFTTNILTLVFALIYITILAIKDNSDFFEGFSALPPQTGPVLELVL